MVRPAHNQRSSAPQRVPPGGAGSKPRRAGLRTADFRKVYAEGRRRNLGIMVAFTRASGEQASRVGLTVPRALGGAVERNRLKRRLREAVRRHWAELGPGWDIVLHPRAEAKTARFVDLEETVGSFFLNCARASGDGRAAKNS
ncbi:MAG: ribonuclease P protein component [Terriglobia bacterium]